MLKLPVYACEGVAHLWPVDPADRTLEPFELREAKWVLLTVMTTRWAIDANIIMQQGTARLISGCVEASGGQLLVPERALTLAKAKSYEPAQRRARHILQHLLNPGDVTPAQLREVTIACTVAIRNAFANWATGETDCNGGVWSFAPETPTSESITASLYAAGIARASTQSGIEDADAVAQALAADCRWIASHNKYALSDDLVPWLAHEQAHGRLEHASNPFICSVDTALETMVTDHEHLAAIAWELGRPDNEDAAQNLAARRDNATRFVEALHDGGATRNAERLAPIIHRKADPQRLDERLSALGHTGTLERTRAAFRRLANATRQAQQNAIANALGQPPNTPQSRRGTRIGS